MRSGVLLGSALALVGLLLIIFFRLAGSQPAPEDVNLLLNGGFEGDFVLDPECGLVGEGWHCFTVGNHTRFVAQPEMWARAVRSGQKAQLLSVITPDPGAPPDRAIGLYQTVRVVPNVPYTLILHGLIRADDLDPDPWRYQVERGYDPAGGTDWRGVPTWQKVPWYRYTSRGAPGVYMSYETTFTPSSDRITIFIRLRVKWGTWPREVILNLDDVALIGPIPKDELVFAPKSRAVTPVPSPTITSTSSPEPLQIAVGSSPLTSAPCKGPNLLENGDFEEGFLAVGVAQGWNAFTDGGPASFGFWDAGPRSDLDSDNRGQVIAINTMGLPAADSALVAGITQTVDGLTPGEVYRVCLRGWIQASERITNNMAITAEWSISTAESQVWYPLSWPIDDASASVLTYTASFTATMPVHTLGVRLRRAPTTTVGEVTLVLRDVHLAPSGGCVYVVQPGDTLTRIARVYKTTVEDLVRRNALSDPNLIRVGQRLKVPCRSER